MEPLVHLRPISWGVEDPQTTSFDGLREGERVSAKQVDVLVAKRGEAGHVLLMQRVILPAELI